MNQNQHRMKIIIGISENNTNHAITLAKKYEMMEADYLLVLTPFYNKCNQEGLIKHFKLIAESVNIPIILYNVPTRTGVNIDIDVIKELKKVPNIVGIKEASISRRTAECGRWRTYCTSRS